MDLAQMNRAFLPRWLNIALWLMAEASIICTDISQVDQPFGANFLGDFMLQFNHLSNIP